MTVTARTSVEGIFLARHGQTEWNLAGRRQGQLDSPLTPAGVTTAVRSARLLREQGIDAVFSSPLGRALSTATFFAGALGLDVVVIDELREVHHGEMAGLTNDEIDARFPGELTRRDHDRYRWCFPGGESYEAADHRAAQALARISRAPARFPLVVSHEMIGRMLLRNLLDLTPENALLLSHPHDTIYQVDVRTKSLIELRPGEG